MNGKTVLYSAIVIFFSITQGMSLQSESLNNLLLTVIHSGAETVSPCDENSWSAFDCIQYLQENILQLREQVSDQAA